MVTTIIPNEIEMMFDDSYSKAVQKRYKKLKKLRKEGDK